MTTTERYHLAELALARNPGDIRHCNPPPLPPEWRILDVGCGAGQTLIACYANRSAFGIDIDLDALRLGRKLGARAAFVGAAAECIPFRDRSFDAVIARVSLPYTDLRLSLPEIRRVLKHGGLLWAVFHPVSIPLRGVRLGRPRTLLYFAYVALNSIFFHFTGRMLPRVRGRCETFQTEPGMRRFLRAAGFVRIKVIRRPHFVVTAEAAAC